MTPKPMLGHYHSRSGLSVGSKACENASAGSLSKLGGGGVDLAHPGFELQKTSCTRPKPITDELLQRAFLNAFWFQPVAAADGLCFRRSSISPRLKSKSQRSSL